jgi:hypothetical protein
MLAAEGSLLQCSSQSLVPCLDSLLTLEGGVGVCVLDDMLGGSYGGSCTEAMQKVGLPYTLYLD